MRAAHSRARNRHNGTMLPPRGGTCDYYRRVPPLGGAVPLNLIWPVGGKTLGFLNTCPHTCEPYINHTVYQYHSTHGSASHDGIYK